jgi:hypothetical protein
MPRKLLAGVVAALVLALGVWLVPTALGSGGSTTSTRATTVAASKAPSPTRPSPGTGCTHAPATSAQ